MFDRKAGVEAQLLRGFQLLRRRALTAAFGDEGRELGRILRQPLGERMVGRDRREARAVKRVGPRREYVEARRAAGEAERDFHPLRQARTSVVQGKSGFVRVVLGGRRYIDKKDNQ